MITGSLCPGIFDGVSEGYLLFCSDVFGGLRIGSGDFVVGMCWECDGGRLGGGKDEEGRGACVWGSVWEGMRRGRIED